MCPLRKLLITVAATARAVRDTQRLKGHAIDSVERRGLAIATERGSSGKVALLIADVTTGSTGHLTSAIEILTISVRATGLTCNVAIHGCDKLL